MADSTPKRKLAAIMFTDMVGYTAMMQEDEDKARELIERHRAHMKPFVKKHGGEIIQFVGDGTFCRFDSAIEAVNSALEIQKVLELEPEINLRIGIHVGDVVVKGDEVYGDGVNVASRLEPLAEPGGICLSGEVYSQIKNRSDIDLVAGGSKELKNVKDPVDIYFISALTDTESESTSAIPHSETSTSGEKVSISPTAGDKSGSKKLIYLAVAVIALLLIIIWNLPFFSSGETALEASGEIRSIAVLPLENLSGDPEKEYFSDGMTEALITDIAKIRSLKVISRTSVMQYKGVRKPLPEIGKELNVDAILEGSVMHAEGEVRITVQLIRASTDEHLWADSYTDKLENIMSLQSKIARAVAKEVKVTLTPEEEIKLSSTKEIIPEAHDSYFRGIYFWNKRTGDEIKKALGYFQKAADVDPGFALAHIGIANSYNLLHQFANLPSKETYPKAMAAANMALEIDPALGEAHISRAYAYIEHYWDWEKAEAAFKKGLELSPNYATGHQWYAEFLSRMGRFEESIEEIKIARELDPLSMVIHIVEGWIYFLAGDFEKGIEIYNTVASLYPEHSWPQYNLSYLYRWADKPEAAYIHLLLAADLDDRAPEEIEELKTTYAKSGWKGLDERRLKNLFKQGGRPAAIADTYISLGEYEKALDWLERGYEERDYFLSILKVGPQYRIPEIQYNPRFQALLEKMNFPDE